MGLFNRKKDPEKEARKELEKTVKDMKECGIDPYDIEQHILAHCNEGRNVDKDGKVFWVCSHCAANIKFKTREEYVAHHSRVHS